MIKDKFKYEIASATVKAFNEAYPDLKRDNPGLTIFDVDAVYDRLEKPRNPEMGNYALPLFELAKEAGLNPVEANNKLAGTQNKLVHESVDLSHLKFSAVGGFNNCRIDTEVLADHVIGRIREQGSAFGSSDSGHGGNIVIDFSSPNIAKPFGVGHLRTTAIGHSLYRIFEKLGYNSIGVNHLGDWGTQFGKLIVAFRLWGNEADLKTHPVDKLYDLYVKFHREEESDPSLSEQAREAFKDLEEGDEEAATLWNKFREYSIESFKKTYDVLGIDFDYYTGESFYNDKIAPALERLEKAGLTEISQGALVVNLEHFNLPPCLLRKADGATLYATRDLAGILYRWETFHFEKALYVVAASQRDHFQQVFHVIRLLDEAEGRPPEERLFPRLEHVEFGWIKFQDEMMSTRKGNIIRLADVLDKAIFLAQEKIREKNPDLKEMESTSRMIGVGAVLFADLATRRQRDVNFDWDEVLNFEGETGPYLQYTHARLSSLLRRYEGELPHEIDFSLLDSPEEALVLDLLYSFPQIVRETADTYEPSILCSYLLNLGGAFNKMYQRKDARGRIDKIISDDEKLTSARIALVEAVRTVIAEGLYLLGIEAPQEM
jgi:arginyl-tRNA synthetase